MVWCGCIQHVQYLRICWQLLQQADPFFDKQINGQLVLLLCVLQGIDSFAADQKKLEEQLAQLAATL